MTRWAVAVDWLAAYRATRIDQMVGMYSSDAVIDCALEGNVATYREDGIVSFWQHALYLKSLICSSVVGKWSSPT